MSNTVLSEEEWENMFKELREEAKESRKNQLKKEHPKFLFGKGIVKTRNYVKYKLESLERNMKALNKKLKTGEISKEEYGVWKNRIYLDDYKKLLKMYEETFVY